MESETTTGSYFLSFGCGPCDSARFVEGSVEALEGAFGDSIESAGLGSCCTVVDVRPF